MGANNWAVCPRCVARDEAAALKQMAEVAGLYGKVPVEEFDAARTAIKKPGRKEDYRTFREDYEIHGAEDGVVVVDYGGSCAMCGLSLEFTDRHPIDKED